MTAATTAIVIGAGIAGPVAATAFSRPESPQRSMRRTPGCRAGSVATWRSRRTACAHWESSAVDDAVRAIALPITGQIMSVNGKGLDLPGLEGVEPMQIVGRGDLQRVLHDRAVEAGVAVPLWQAAGRTVENTATGVTARFSDGSTATADVLIGADGVRSAVRKLIDPAAPDAGYTGLLGFQGSADLDLDLDPGVMTFAFGKRAYYLYWKAGDGRVTWGANLPSKQYLSTTDARAIPAADWLTTLREIYAGDIPGAQLANLTTEDTLRTLGAIHIMPPVPHWHRDRMVLVGDAVHAPSNSTGQGASLAIESAIQLARCLRDLPDPCLRVRRVRGATPRAGREDHPTRGANE